MTDNISEYLKRPARTEEQARIDIAIDRSTNVVRLATKLNALIMEADAAFLVKLSAARAEYSMLLRRLPWDYQNERRDHELSLFCDEAFGDLGPAVAWQVMRWGDQVGTVEFV